MEGVRFHRDLLTPACLTESREARRARGVLRRIFGLLKPARRAMAPLERWVAGRTLVVGRAEALDALALRAVGLEIDLGLLAVARDLRAAARGPSCRSDRGRSTACSATTSSSTCLRRCWAATWPIRRGCSCRAGCTRSQRPIDCSRLPRRRATSRCTATRGGKSSRSARASGSCGPRCALDEKKSAEQRAAASGGRAGLNQRGLRMVTIVARR